MKINCPYIQDICWKFSLTNIKTDCQSLCVIFLFLIHPIICPMKWLCTSNKWVGKVLFLYRRCYGLCFCAARKAKPLHFPSYQAHFLELIKFQNMNISPVYVWLNLFLAKVLFIKHDRSVVSQLNPSLQMI